MKVHEIMTTRARCVGPDNTLVEAAGLMRQLDIGAVPVCEGDHLLGMLTDRDIAIRAVADGRDPNTTLVRDVMSHGLIYASAEQEVEEIVRLMENKKIRRIPVLNRARRLVGIISLGDIAVTSNPAFSGLALREVSESVQTLDTHRARAAAASRPPGAGMRAALHNGNGSNGTAHKDQEAETPSASRTSPRSRGQSRETTGARHLTKSTTRRQKSPSPRSASTKRKTGKSRRTKTK